MAKKRGRKPAQAASTAATGEVVGSERGAKSAAVRAYLKGHRKAMPKEVVAALKEQNIDVSPNMVSILKAKSKIRKARRTATADAAGPEKGSASALQSGKKAGALDAALTLYKAARGQDIQPGRVRQAFLMLVEVLG